MIHSFRVQNYRCFKDFKIEHLDRVNLITGSNNVGKSALLEALYLNLVPGTAFQSNLESSPEEISTRLNLFRGFVSGMDNRSKWGWLFYGKDFTKEICLNTWNDGGTQSVRMQWLNETATGSAPIPSDVPLEDLNTSLNVYIKKGIGEEIKWRLERDGRGLPARHLLDAVPVRLLVDTSPRLPRDDTKWFSKLADVGRQDEVVETLKLIEPRLKGLAVSTSDGPAMIYGDIGVGRRIPMSQMGEGMVRLLSIILEVANASGGAVLIDEVEAGLHHSVLTRVWRAIGEAARRSNTQIFATTHSGECIRAAHEAFLESGHYDLRLHRLERINGEIKAMTYDEETLETSVEMNLEVR